MRREPGACTIVVVQPNLASHRLIYVRHVLEYCRSRDLRVVLVTRHRELDRPGAAEILGEVCVVEMPGDCTRMSDQISFLHGRFDESARFVWLDGDVVIRSLLCRRRSRQHVVLIMRPFSQGATVRFAVKRCLAWAARRRGIRLRGLVQDWTESAPIRPTVADPIEFAPTEAPFLRRLPTGSVVVAIAGSIDPRKKPGLVAEAVGTLAGHVLVTAGPVSAEVAADLDRPWIVSEDRFLDSGELDAVIQASSCVVVAYDNAGSSGIIGKAALAGTPIVSIRGTHVGCYVAARGLGPVAASATVRDLSLAIARSGSFVATSHADLFASPAAFVRELVGIG